MGVRGSVARTMSRLPSGLHEAVPAEMRTLMRHRLGRYYAWEVGFDHRATPTLEPGELIAGTGDKRFEMSWAMASAKEFRAMPRAA